MSRRRSRLGPAALRHLEERRARQRGGRTWRPRTVAPPPALASAAPPQALPRPAEPEQPPPAEPPPAEPAPAEPAPAEPAPPQGVWQQAEVVPLLADRKPQRLGKRRYTLFVVPDGGRGPLRQVELSLRQVRLGLTLGAVTAVLAVLGVVSTTIAVPATRARDALLDENIALKARMQDVERKLDEVDAQLRRLRLYNTQLEELPLDGIPGFGPLDPGEAGKLLWLGRVDPDDWTPTGPGSWQEGTPMEEPPGDEVAPADLTEAEALALELSRRAERALLGFAMVEPQAGELVETAQEWRWRQETAPTLMPVPDGTYTSGFGWRRAPFSRRWKFHTGIDLAAPRGTPVYAAGAGVVDRAEWSSGYGQMIVVDHGEGVVSRYAHNSRMLVRAGDKVTRGQQIATVGTTGRTTGPHLHFEVYIDGVAVDPAQFIELPFER